MRIKPGVAKHRRLRRILKAVKGYRGARNRRIKLAKEAIIRAGAAAYVGRRLRKRQFRRLWITRLNAAVRERGLSYSRFVDGLKKDDSELDVEVSSPLNKPPSEIPATSEKTRAAPYNNAPKRTMTNRLKNNAPSVRVFTSNRRSRNS